MKIKEKIPHILHKARSLVLDRPKLFTGIMLVSLTILVYFRWMNFDIFTYGDWNFRFLESLRESTSPFSWVGDIGFGSFNEFVWRMPLDVLFGLFSWAGMGINISDKFLIFWPLVVTTIIAPYLLVKEITQRRVAALAATLFYATNTYFLAINSQGHQLLPLAFNILTLAFTVFIRAMRSGRTVLFIWTALLLFVAGFIDFRVCYIGVFLLGAYTLAFWPRRKDRAFKKIILRNVLLFFGITIGLQLYWLFAFALNISSGSEVLARSLFGNSFWDLGSVVTLHHPFWNGTTTTWFMNNSIPVFFWIIPLLALWGWLLKPRSKYLLFFIVTAIVGILLGKQVSEPFRDIYTFLFNNFPGFSAFREATKFYYLTLLGYSVLVGYLIMRLYDARPKERLRRFGKYGVIGVFALLCIINAWPYISGSIGRLSTPRTLPADYATLEQQLSKENDYSRTLWVPASSRWSYYTLQHPRVNATSLLTTRLDHPGDKRDVPTQQNILQLLQSNTFEHYLSITSTKYVIVPVRDIENQNDFFSFYGDSRQPYVDALDALPFLKKTATKYDELAVYENQNYRPYATATSKLYSMQEPADFAGAYPLLSTALNDGQYIAGTEKGSGHPKTDLSDVFSRLTTQDFQQPTFNISKPEAQSIFFNTNKSFYSYEISRHNSIDLYRKKAISQATPTSINLGTSKPVISSSVQIEPNKTYFLKSKDGLVPIDTKQPKRDFGSLEGEVSIYVSDNTNLLANGSFEQGAWDKQVRDCDAYDTKPSIGMNLNTVDYNEGKQSINLWALRHTACTQSPQIPVSAGTYLLSFDYKAPYSDQISYRVAMDGKETSAIMRPVANNTGGWITYRDLVTIPAGVTTSSIELRGLPPGSFSPLARFTSFDNVRFTSLEVASVADKSPGGQNYQKIHTVPANAPMEIGIESKPGAENLIANPSLEEGLWQEEPGDCNNYDENPAISMNASKVANDGKQSLELRARRHIACSGPDTIAVKEGKTYLLRFDYQAENTKTARYNLSFNDYNKLSQSRNLEANGSWRTYQYVIKVPLGASEMNLRLHAVSDETGRVEAVNRYDNFSLIEVPDVMSQLFAVDELAAKVAPKSVTTNHASSAKKEFTVQDAKDPFYLSMTESYHAGWKLDGVADSEHFKTAGFLNGWHVDPTAFCAERPSDCTQNANGTYDMRLTAQFTPQKWLGIGTVLSIFVLAGTITLLVRKRKEVVPPPIVMSERRSISKIVAPGTISRKIRAKK